jgi:uncharacterized protein (DUF302 family)
VPDYVIETTVPTDFATTIENVRAALAEQGFGVLSEIYVHEKLKEKIGADMKPYVILGACHPPSAFKAITEEESIGVLMPCNVVVCETDEGMKVKAVRPSQSLAVTGRRDLAGLADEVEGGLRRMIESL